MKNQIKRISQSQSLLNQILSRPNWIQVIQKLDAHILSQLIHHIGLEDSGELVALATTEQLTKIFDDDLWKNESPGQEEKLDIDRFSVWLEILFEIGEEFAVQKITEMDEDFLVMALSQQVLVIDVEQLAIQVSGRGGNRSAQIDLEEKVLESSLHHEFEEYRIISRRSEGWDTILTLLVALDRDHHSFLRRILDRCAYLSSEFIDDNGGLFQVLTAEEMLETDVAYEREKRREKGGFVSPLDALGFLNLARVSSRSELFRTKRDDFFRSPPSSSAPQMGDRDIEQFMGFLKKKGVVKEEEASLLLDSSQRQQGLKQDWIRMGLLSLHHENSALYFDKISELNYLANVLVSGCSYKGRKFRSVEAAEAVLATCNLGLEWISSQSQCAVSPSERELAQMIQGTSTLKLFQIGWNILYQDITVLVGRSLLERFAAISVSDSWLQDQLKLFREKLKKTVAQGKPWLCRKDLELFSAIFGSEEWVILEGLIDECPTLDQLHSDEGRQVIQTHWISTHQQIQRAQAWLEKGFKKAE
jgi:hypothetical protein